MDSKFKAVLGYKSNILFQYIYIYIKNWSTFRTNLQNSSKVSYK